MKTIKKVCGRDAASHLLDVSALTVSKEKTTANQQLTNHE